MSRRPRGLLVLGIAAGVLLAAASANFASQVNGKDAEPAKGDELPAPKSVDIVTVDKVELKAKFFPPKKGDAPCVMLLHALGDSSSNKEWNNFAKKLQEKGYAVLTFDFRGHGESTTVQPGTPNKNPSLAIKGFWDEPINQKNVKGYSASKPRPTEIKYENFSTAYYSVLANDIAAAKAFLDEQSDCNSGNLFVIGVKDGATLGALWVNSEFQRFRFLAPGPMTPKGSLDRQNSEGLAISACVWISPSQTLGLSKSPVNLAAMLQIAGKVHKMPMLFVYGQGDDKGKTLATYCEKVLTGNDKKAYANTGVRQIDKAEKATGKELLVADLDTTAKILDYLDSLPGRKGPANKRTGEETYMWEFQNAQGVTQQVTAKDAGSKLLKFSAYYSFQK